MNSDELGQARTDQRDSDEEELSFQACISSFPLFWHLLLKRNLWSYDSINTGKSCRLFTPYMTPFVIVRYKKLDQLRQVVKTVARPHGEITPEEFTFITGQDFHSEG